MPADAEVIATRVSSDIRLDSRNPPAEWGNAAPIRFCTDWRGKNSEPALETEVRVLWSNSNFYVRFVCHYRELFVFDESDANGRRDHLWDRDVAEAFLQPEPSSERRYKEFEVAPDGKWIDLDITSGGPSDLKSGLSRSVHIDEKARLWVAELAIPMRSLTPQFDPTKTWRANFYR